MFEFEDNVLIDTVLVSIFIGIFNPTVTMIYVPIAFIVYSAIKATKAYKDKNCG